jgi:hypothetical protein
MTTYYKVPTTNVNTQLAALLMSACLQSMKLIKLDDAYFIPSDMLIMHPDLVDNYNLDAAQVPNKLLILSDPTNRIKESVDWYGVHMDIQIDNNYAATVCDNKVIVSDALVDDYIKDYSAQRLNIEVRNM